MGTFRLGWMDRPAEEVTGGAITVGNFDGVHLGHQRLISAARELARPVVAVTFDPPPSVLLHPPSQKPPLSTSDERSDRLHQAGADHVVELKTDAGLLALSPEAFFEDVICGLLEAQAIAEGENFRFGRGRTGDIAALRSMCQQRNLRFSVVRPLLDGDEAISSSRIRHGLARGEMSAVTRWLGREYGITGVVEQGAQRGRTIGIPTVNLGQVTTLIPAEGVYAGYAEWQGERRPAAINIGPNPSFGEIRLKIEAHLLDFQGDLYGRSIRLTFRERLRGVIRFANIDDLVRQLKADIEQTRRLT
jgi:riboflavin kinase / FMN adenylyltransferase